MYNQSTCPKQRSVLVALRLLAAILATSGGTIQPARIRAEEELESRIRKFCGDCHAVPNPARFEKKEWYEQARKGFEIYARTGRTDLAPPSIDETVQYYQSLAPETLTFSVASEVATDWVGRFFVEKVDWKDSAAAIPAAISSIQSVVSKGKPVELLVTDCRDGSISMLSGGPGSTKRTILFRAQNPARITQSDLNQDGHSDYLVADLGSLYPYDHNLGKVAALAGSGQGKPLRPVLIQDRMGRIADIDAGQLLGNSNPDLVVAEFGHRDSGGLHILENIAEQSGTLAYRSKRIDPRPGVVRVFVQDWDNDGTMDIAALTSQEHESVDLYLNRNGNFERRTVWRANDLTFGSVSLERVDLDLDGDQDLILCNGDAFDNQLANPSHGVQWLENRGGARFDYHRLMDLPGAYCAKAIDIDQDNDLDIVAVSNLPKSVRPVSLQTDRVVSIALLENTGNMQFQPRTLSLSPARYSTLEVGDFDRDGTADFVVGGFALDPTESVPRLTFWWGKRP
jgi:hypothetical protein